MKDTTRNALVSASVNEADLARLEGGAPAALDDLAQRLEIAQTQQAAQLQEAMAGMLDAMPRLLRGPVKKLFER